MEQSLGWKKCIRDWILTSPWSWVQIPPSAPQACRTQAFLLGYIEKELWTTMVSEGYAIYQKNIVYIHKEVDILIINKGASAKVATPGLAAAIHQQCPVYITQLNPPDLQKRIRLHSYISIPIPHIFFMCGKILVHQWLGARI